MKATSARNFGTLYEICRKVFSYKDEPELLAILTQSKVDLNGRVVSAEGVTYLHPPLYYATLAMNEAAIKRLQEFGADFSRMSQSELKQIRRELSEEIEHLLNPTKAIKALIEKDKEIAVHLPDSVRGRINENSRDREIQRRREYIELLDNAIGVHKTRLATSVSRKQAVKELVTLADSRKRTFTL